MRGVIVKNISNDYTVEADGIFYRCKPPGKFRFMSHVPLVGDQVEFDSEECYLTKIYPRKNELVRPRVANVDQAFVLVSVKDPDLDLHLLDTLLVIIEFNRIQPVLCFTKLDCLSDRECRNIDSLRTYYQSIGYPVYYNSEIDDIRKCFENKITVFTGQSGAGKSTLLNRLNVDLDLETNAISLSLGRGKHTTRHVELHPVWGGLVADTPGFSSVDFYGMTSGDIRDNMVEFNVYREMCKYKDCMHDREDDCAIKREVSEGHILLSRYENYLKFIKKVKE